MLVQIHGQSELDGVSFWKYACFQGNHFVCVWGGWEEGTVVVMVVCWWFCQCVNEVYKEQWHSHWEVKGSRVPPWQQKNCQKLGKRRKKMGKRGKIVKKRQKSGRFFHFALLTGLAMLLIRKSLGVGMGVLGWGGVYLGSLWVGYWVLDKWHSSYANTHKKHEYCAVGFTQFGQKVDWVSCGKTLSYWGEVSIGVKWNASGFLHLSDLFQAMISP